MSWFTDILGSITGDTQKKYLTQSYNKSNNYIKKGTDQAYGYMDEAKNMYSPMVQEGKAAWDMYNNALGLNGVANAGIAAQSIYTNPIFTDMNNYTQQQNLAYQNARGNAGGGNALWASQDITRKQMNDWLNRYAKLGERGDEGLNKVAGITLGKGDLAYGSNATLAGNALSHGNAMAQAAGTLPNNIINATAAFMGGSPSTPTYNQQPTWAQNGSQANGGWSTVAQADPNYNSRYGLQFGNNFFGWSA